LTIKWKIGGQQAWEAKENENGTEGRKGQQLGLAIIEKVNRRDKGRRNEEGRRGEEEVEEEASGKSKTEGGGEEEGMAKMPMRARPNSTVPIQPQWRRRQRIGQIRWEEGR
jgi:hypothetical protein